MLAIKPAACLTVADELTHHVEVLAFGDCLAKIGRRFEHLKCGVALGLGGGLGLGQYGEGNLLLSRGRFRCNCRVDGRVDGIHGSRCKRWELSKYRIPQLRFRITFAIRRGKSSFPAGIVRLIGKNELGAAKSGRFALGA
jgi:hypothetical protein